jgi:hypothetical protein
MVFLGSRVLSQEHLERVQLLTAEPPTFRRRPLGRNASSRRFGVTIRRRAVRALTRTFMLSLSVIASPLAFAAISFNACSGCHALHWERQG